MCHSASWWDLRCHSTGFGCLTTHSDSWTWCALLAWRLLNTNGGSGCARFGKRACWRIVSSCWQSRRRSMGKAFSGCPESLGRTETYPLENHLGWELPKGTDRAPHLNVLEVTLKLQMEWCVQKCAKARELSLCLTLAIFNALLSVHLCLLATSFDNCQTLLFQIAWSENLVYMTSRRVWGYGWHTLRIGMVEDWVEKAYL